MMEPPSGNFSNGPLTLVMPQVRWYTAILVQTSSRIAIGMAPPCTRYKIKK